MIRIIINPADIKVATARIENKVNQVEFAVSPKSLTEIAKATFTLTGRRFIRDLSAEAIADPAKFHHIYEWGKVGSPASKLFILKRTNVQYGNLIIQIELLKSNTIVPINPELLVPGPTGRSVSAQHIFREKAKIMEEGKPINISSSRVMAFYVKDQGIVFVPAGTVIHVMHPGGEKTAGALAEYAHSWYATRPNMIIESSRLIGQIGNAVAAAVNTQGSSFSTVYSAIKKVTSAYSEEMVVL
jgi:hypothetical protein